MAGRRSQRHADEPERLRADPVFALAQVTVLVKIMLTVLLLDPRSFDTFTLPKSVVGHAASLVLAALLVWLLARHGRALLVWSPIHAAAGALLVAFAISSAFAVDPTIALFGAFKRYLGLTQMLDNVLLYLGVGILFRDQRSLRLLAGVGIGVTVPVLAYALIQRLELDPLRFVQNATRVPISTLGNPDIAGAFVSVVGVSALGLALLLGGPPLGAARAAFGLVAVGCMGVLYATGVRAGVLAIGGGWLAAALLSLTMPHATRTRSWAAAVIAALLALGVVVSPIGARLDLSALASDPALISRVDIWRAASMAIVERPVLGIGPDNFAAAYPSRRAEASLRTQELQTSTHDVWLYMATSAGVVGLAAFALFITFAIDRAFRLGGRGHPASLALIPLLAYLGQALVNVNEIAVDWILWTSVGVIAGASGTRLTFAVPGRPARAANSVGAVALFAATLIGSVTLAPRLVAGEAMLASEAFAGAGRAQEAIPYAETAVSADPRRAQMWSAYGSALYPAGRAAAAVRAFSAAADREAWQPLSWKNLAITWDGLGNAAAAYAAADRAVASDPYDGTAREILARFAYGRGDFARAAREGERAIAYEFPPQASAYFTTISAYVRLKDLDRAEPLARAASERYQTLELRLQYAAILADRGRTADAMALVDAILTEHPDDAGARALKNALVGGSAR